MLNRLRRPTFILAIGFAVLTAILVAALTISEGERRDAALVRHTFEVENRLAALLAGLQDAETGQRGFVITGDEKYLAPFQAGRSAIGKDVDAVAQMTADNPVQQTNVSRLRPLVQQRLDSLEKGIDLRRTGGLSAASAYIVEGRGKAIMDEVRRQLAAMRGEEDRLLQVRQAKADATRRALRGIVGLGLLALFALTAFTVLTSNRQVNRLRLSLDQLANANERLTAEGQAREQAEGQVRQMQKMEAVGQLTGGIAHDFNNMLSVVVGSLELARRRMRSEPERAESCIDNALEGAQRAAGLTARLLAFSRQQPLAPSPLDPNKLVGGMSELLRRTIGEHLRVETVLAGGVWRVNADPQQLENAVLNLCVNARDAMPDGGHMTIETSNAHLDEAYADAHAEVTPGQYVMISITDTGVGMTPEIVQRAFDPFYTTKGVGHGTGLGLSQVFGFVKQSGGHIKIYSEVGRGTSVKIYLPRWVGDLAADEPRATQTVPRAHDNEIVLLVEDDEKVRHVTTDTLRELGYTVVPASNGEDALQQMVLQPRSTCC